jgi:bifunctional non-homologous end joining protein LigD
MQNITLYFRQGSSDKVYQAAIKPKDGGYVVTFAYGRRGSTLATGSKTNAPVPYEDAKRIYDKLIAEKTAKGYTPGADGTPYQGTDKANAATGIHCQLLNPIDESDADRLIADPAWWMQEKHDGRRLLIRKQDGAITGINRLGLTVALPQPMADDAAQCPIDFILDGEAIGDTLHAFDALLIGDDEIGGCRYGERYLRLMNLLASFQHRSIRLVETAFLPKHKAARLQQFRTAGAEGVVFKHTDAPYIAGRPASGGTQLKYKFCETASFIVRGINDQRSVSLGLSRGGAIVSAGNVTIPPNQAVPCQGAVVEVRYLYAFPESGAVYQPVYLGEREDIAPAECIVEQLKYKVPAAAA